MTTDGDRLLTVQEMAAQLHVSTATIGRMIDRGELSGGAEASLDRRQPGEVVDGGRGVEEAGRLSHAFDPGQGWGG